ncbi:sensor histidine kinase [Neorhodopirellula pilleata]|uniref:sensor histidine kinase n=1 Tax=Neorhodopirellula pilleata TaxID=2714738 RepID=UPI0018CE5B23|nr:ATP-binding protein [Neorhodopirellula pilleata]
MSKSLIEWSASGCFEQTYDHGRSGNAKPSGEDSPRLIPPETFYFPRLDQFLRMSNRVSALSSILRSPARILGIVLMLVFIAEVGVMLVLPHLMPKFLGETGKAFLDAVLLTLVCAPVLWWVIIGPLRRIAIQEHRRSETIVANASEGIVTFDHAGMILSCNRAMTDLFSAELDDLVGKTAASFLQSLPRSFDSLPASFRLSARRFDGTTFPVEVSVSEYPSESRPLRIAIIRDLTATEQAEAERLTMARETEALRAQQMTTLAQLATGVAHEIRNPLTSIKMLIQVNRGKFADEGFPNDDLELVEQEIRRMERSVNSLLDYARPEQGEHAVFPIQSVIRKTVQLIDGRCQSSGVKLSVDCDDDPITIDGDPSQIQQLLLNLSLNALDAMPSGGNLTIAAKTTAGELELSVSDSGEGIRDDMLAKLFTPFSTSKPTGVGLGLGICRRIAVSHGGTLTGRNRVTGGAEFKLVLPIAGECFPTEKLISNSADRGAFGHTEASCKPY